MESFIRWYCQAVDFAHYYTTDARWIGNHLRYGVVVSAFIWVPIVFAAFAKGRGSTSRRFWVTFAIVETIALIASLPVWGVPRE
jgi:hypothetical protein